MKWVNVPNHYSELLGVLPKGVRVLSKANDALDFIHFFPKNLKDYERQLPRLQKALAPKGMIWVSWAKAASKVPTDVTEKMVRDYALKGGLVDIKVCSVDDIWSGLKLVIPLKDRKK